MIGMRIAIGRTGPAALLGRDDGVDRHVRYASIVVVVSSRHSVRNAYATAAIAIEEAFVVRRARRLLAHARDTEAAYFTGWAARILARLRSRTSGIGKELTAGPAKAAGFPTGAPGTAHTGRNALAIGARLPGTTRG